MTWVNKLKQQTLDTESFKPFPLATLTTASIISGKVVIVISIKILSSSSKSLSSNLDVKIFLITLIVIFFLSTFVNFLYFSTNVITIPTITEMFAIISRTV